MDYWQEQGKCKNPAVAPLFFDSHSTNKAKAICAGCPVREKCLEYAMAHLTSKVDEENVDGKYWVWGGTTVSERVELRRQRAKGKVGA